MSERCPLELTELELDSEGWLWEPNIPTECHGCLNQITEEQEVAIFHEVADEATGKAYPDGQDRYFVRGICVTDDFGGRLGISESGIDLGGGYDGPVEVESLYKFNCSK